MITPLTQVTASVHLLKRLATTKSATATVVVEVQIIDSRIIIIILPLYTDRKRAPTSNAIGLRSITGSIHAKKFLNAFFSWNEY